MGVLAAAAALASSCAFLFGFESFESLEVPVLASGVDLSAEVLSVLSVLGFSAVVLSVPVLSASGLVGTESVVPVSFGSDDPVVWPNEAVVKTSGRARTRPGRTKRVRTNLLTLITDASWQPHLSPKSGAS